MSLNIDKDLQVFTRSDYREKNATRNKALTAFWELKEYLPAMKGHLDINDALAVMDIKYRGAGNECGCVLTGSTQS